MTALNTVGAVSCRPLDKVTRLDIRTAVKPDYTIVDSDDPAKVIVEIANAIISEKDTKTLDLTAMNLDVVKVTAFPYAKGDAQFVRVVAQLRRPVPFRASRRGPGAGRRFREVGGARDAPRPRPPSPAASGGARPQRLPPPQLAAPAEPARSGDAPDSPVVGSRWTSRTRRSTTSCG